MRIIRSLDKININKPLCLTIGNFDGFHLGHKKILNKIKEIAKHENIPTAVLSFEPHPTIFFKKKFNDYRINSASQKLKFIKDFGIDYAIILNFNQNLSQISANQFLEQIILNTLNTKYIIVGHDFCFGKNKQGNISFLKDNESKLNFKTITIDPVFIDKVLCSSSNVRLNIKNSQIKEANQILGHCYNYESIVLTGNKLGSKIGFPTVNLASKNSLLKPKYGVYKTKTFLPHLNQKFDSITNFGVKPTVSNQNKEIFETHIFDFNQEIYGRKICLEFFDFIREEKKFSSTDELRKQIYQDINTILT